MPKIKCIEQRTGQVEKLNWFNIEAAIDLKRKIRSVTVSVQPDLIIDLCSLKSPNWADCAKYVAEFSWILRLCCQELYKLYILTLGHVSPFVAIFCFIVVLLLLL